MAIAASVHLPVESREIVARQILSILREFDAEPFERAAMEAGEESLDGGPRLGLHRTQLRDDRGIEESQIAGAGRRGHGLTYRSAASAPPRADDRRGCLR